MGRLEWGSTGKHRVEAYTLHVPWTCRMAPGVVAAAIVLLSLPLVCVRPVFGVGV